MPSKVVEDPMKIPGTAGRFHGNPVSRNQPCKWPPTSAIILKELQWRNFPDPVPTMNHFTGVGIKGWALNWQKILCDAELKIYLCRKPLKLKQAKV